MITGIAVLPDGRVVTGDFYGQVRVWDPAHPGEPDQIGVYDSMRGIRIAVLPDGRIVTTGNDEGLVLAWDPAHPGAPDQIGDHGSNVLAIAVLLDGRVVTGGDDGRILVWDPDQPGAIPPEEAVISADVMYLAVSGPYLITAGPSLTFWRL